MTRSLADDLRTLAHSGPADPGAAIADRAGHMVRAIRHRRVARQTGMGAVGVGAAAAVMIGVSHGPGWRTAGPASDGDPDGLSATAVATPSTEPSTDPTSDPTPEPTPTESASAPAVDTPSGQTVSDGLALLAERYDIDLSCGATFTAASQVAAGSTFADHLTPRFVAVPTSLDQPVSLVNEYGRDTPGPLDNGWARMSQAVVVTADDVVVGFGGGALRGGEPTPVYQEFAVDLPALVMCPTPVATTVVTVYGVSSEAGFDGVRRTQPATADEERLSTSYGLSIDLATGEQWFGEPADKASALADDSVPMTD